MTEPFRTDARQNLAQCLERLTREPHAADAWSRAGLAALEMGARAEALGFFRTAAKLAPEVAEHHFRLGMMAAKDDVRAALPSLSAAVRLAPEWVEARRELAEALLTLERPAEAELHLRWLIERAPTTDVQAMLGTVCAMAGRAGEAVVYLEAAVQARPDLAKTRKALGLSLVALGRYESALEHLSESVRLDSSQIGVWESLGDVHRILRQPDQALAAYRRAAEHGRESLDIRMSCITLLLQSGQSDEARREAEAAVAAHPNAPAAHNILGATHQAETRPDAAAAAFRAALAIDDSFRPAHVNLIAVLAEMGEVNEARKHGQRALAIRHSDALRVRLAMLLRPIYQSQDELIDARDQFERALDDLADEPLHIDDPLTEVGSTNFYLAFQGKNDRDLQRKFARLFRFLPKEMLGRSRTKSERPRIGFVSRHLMMANHPVAICCRGLLADLAKHGLEVVIFPCEPVVLAPPDGTRCVPLSPNLSAAREIIAREELDVLVYPDIGMDPFTYFLAFTRLAPVQAALGGHPVTTGIPNMDYYVSTKGFEGPHAPAHYTETLILLDRPPNRFDRPRLAPHPVPRSEFGLPEDRRLYVCPMMLQKFHPEFDWALAEILRRDPQGDVILFRDVHRWDKLLDRRFARTMPDVMDRVRWMDAVPSSRFAELLRACDVVLDTFHFGSGSTTLFTFAAGTPFVTWPSEFLRGRAVAGFYQLIGVDGPVAKSHEEYVELALRSGKDRHYRAHIAAKTVACCGSMFEDQTAAGELARHFEKWSRG